MKKNMSNGPGRPKYTPVLPKGKFTFTDLEIANGVNPKTGKGKSCTTLTLRKWLKRELAKRGHSAIVHLKDTLADPNGKNGLGRKQYVYQRRAGVTLKASVPAPKAAPKATAPKATRKPRAVAAPAVADVSPETQSYEAKKAELLAPVVSIAPAPMPVAAPALVDKTNAPETAETAPVVAAEQPAEQPEVIELKDETATETTDEATPAEQPIAVPAPALVG